MEKVSFFKKYKVLLIVVSVLLVILAGAFFVLNSLLPTGDTIAYGVRLGETELGGMTVAQAEEAVLDDYYMGKAIIISGEPGREVVKPESIGLLPDKKKTAEKAFGIGRDSNWFENVWNAIKLKRDGIEIFPTPKADNELLDAVLLARGIKLNGEGRDITIEDVSETSVKILPAIPGQKNDVSKTRKEFLREIEVGNYRDILLNFETYERNKVSAKDLFDMLTGELKDASYVMVDGKVEIEKDSAKREVSLSEIEEKIALLNDGKEIALTSKSILPEYTYEKLSEKLFTKELASYKSTYSTSAKGRAYNLSRAANSVNGTILMPGDVFSYNDTIGNPSLANGYKIAPVYANGKESTGVGGGVCQISSTLYSAVLYANLEIVERRNHSLTVAYVPKGQDATVAYGAVDFKFKNNTPYPIRIDAVASGGVCTVKIIGGAPDVDTTVKVINSVNQTISPTVTEIIDPTKPADYRKVTEKGKTGYKVSSVRVVYENGVEVKREQLTSSYYRMLPSEVTVGKKEEVPVIVPVTPEPEIEETPVPTESEEPSLEPTEEPFETILPAETDEVLEDTSE